MIYTDKPLPVEGQMCREFGHLFTTTYSRPWRKFFKLQTRTFCVACDPSYRVEVIEQLKKCMAS